MLTLRTQQKEMLNIGFRKNLLSQSFMKKNNLHKVEFEIAFLKNKYPGKFIVFEGNEASGKTTHTKDLVKKLVEKGLKVWSTKEPTDSVIGKLIRQILSRDVKANPQALQYLFAADRALHQEEI